MHVTVPVDTCSLTISFLSFNTTHNGRLRCRMTLSSRVAEDLA